MKLTTANLEARMAFPDAFKTNLLKFFRENNLSVDQAKSIGTLEFYDQQVAPTAPQVLQFFTGTFSTTRTNLPSNFVRPQSEHMIITAFKVADGINAAIAATDWVIGGSLPAVKNATMTVQSNGVTYLRNMPLLAGNDEVTDESRGVIYLAEPIIWPAQTELQVSVNFPTAAAANSNLRLSILGVGTLS